MEYILVAWLIVAIFLLGPSFTKEYSCDTENAQSVCSTTYNLKLTMNKE